MDAIALSLALGFIGIGLIITAMVAVSPWDHYLISLLIGLTGVLCLVSIIIIDNINWDIETEEIVIEEQVIPFESGEYINKFKTEDGMGYYIRLSETEIKEISNYNIKYSDFGKAVYQETKYYKEWNNGILKEEYTEKVLILPSDKVGFTVVS